MIRGRGCEPSWIGCVDDDEVDGVEVGSLRWMLLTADARMDSCLCDELVVAG